MHPRRRAVGIAAILGLALPAFAAAQQGALPQPKTQGNVTFVSGGVGRNESDALKQAEKEYPLSMLFSEGKRGAYLAGVQVTITNRAGDTLLQAVSDGPIMLVRLPPGDYRVSAQANGKALQREAKVAANGGTHLSFNWPER